MESANFRPPRTCHACPDAALDPIVMALPYRGRGRNKSSLIALFTDYEQAV
jgi:hypothetical protein